MFDYCQLAECPHDGVIDDYADIILLTFMGRAYVLHKECGETWLRFQSPRLLHELKAKQNYRLN